MVDKLAVLEAESSQLASVIRRAALYSEGNDPHEEMYVRIDESGIETPASAADAVQTSYCSADAEQFRSLTVHEPVQALFPVPEVLKWLEWFGPNTVVNLAFLGETGAEVSTDLEIRGPSRRVRISCIDDPTLLTDVEVWLPQRFDGDQFLDEAGNPFPTTIETSVEELETLVTAVEHAEGVDTFPITVVDGEFLLEFEGTDVDVSGTLDASIDGPDVRNQYGPGLARIVHAIEGDVTLQTTPGGDIALVNQYPQATLRFHVRHWSP